MAPADRDAAIERYSAMFDESEDELELIRTLGTPTKVAIELARGYVPSEAEPPAPAPEPVKAEAEKPAPELGEVLAEEDDLMAEFFGTQTQETEPEPEQEPAPEPEQEEKQEQEPESEPEPETEPEPEAEPAPETAEPETEPEPEPAEAEPAPETPEKPKLELIQGGKTPTERVAAGIRRSNVDIPGPGDLTEAGSAGEREAEGGERPRRRMRGVALAFFIPGAVIIGLPVALILVLLGVPLILLGGGAVYLAVFAVIQLAGVFHMFSDLLLAAGFAFGVCAAGLLLFWFGLWLSISLARLWIEHVVLRLGRACFKTEGEGAE